MVFSFVQSDLFPGCPAPICISSRWQRCYLGRGWGYGFKGHEQDTKVFESHVTVRMLKWLKSRI